MESFTYSLWKWIRQHRKELSSPASCGLTTPLIQQLFAFDRAFRGASTALQPHNIQTVHAYQLSNVPRLGKGKLTTDQFRHLQSLMSGITRSLQEPDNAQSALGRELLSLPAPSEQLTLPFEERHLQQLAHKTLAASELKGAFQIRLGRLNGQWQLTLMTLLRLEPEKGVHMHYFEARPEIEHAKRQAMFPSLTLPEHASYGQWLRALDLRWLELEKCLGAWLAEKSIYPTPQHAQRLRIQRLREKLDKLLSREEQAFLREHREAILGASL